MFYKWLLSLVNTDALKIEKTSIFKVEWILKLLFEFWSGDEVRKSEVSLKNC